VTQAAVAAAQVEAAEVVPAVGEEEAGPVEAVGRAAAVGEEAEASRP
jgi:hypothetical protein